MSSYFPGDLIITELSVNSQRGTLDLSNSFVAASIYESVFTPGTVADIVVLDTQDQLGILKLQGDEIIIFSCKTPGGDTSNFVFFLYSIVDVNSTGAQKSKMYTLQGVSQEAMYAKTHYVQKSYMDTCSNIVKDIHSNPVYLNSQKDLNVEDSSGPQKILIPHKSPYQAINLVKKRAVSVDTKSSSFVYYESRNKGKQTYNFVTLESLFSKDVVKSFQQSDAINTSILNQQDNNILAYRVPKQLSSIDKIHLAGPRRTTVFNFTTQQFTSNVVQTTATKFITAGVDAAKEISSLFSSLFFDTENPKFTLSPMSYSQVPDSNISGSLADKQAYVALLLQNAMKIRVPGDMILTAGAMINCNIPNKQGLTGPIKLDPLMSGNFLITRIHHRIGMVVEKPRYTCVIEGIKGTYAS